jgi:hypothetical protein
MKVVPIDLKLLKTFFLGDQIMLEAVVLPPKHNYIFGHTKLVEVESIRAADL